MSNKHNYHHQREQTNSPNCGNRWYWKNVSLKLVCCFVLLLFFHRCCCCNCCCCCCCCCCYRCCCNCCCFVCLFLTYGGFKAHFKITWNQKVLLVFLIMPDSGSGFVFNNHIIFISIFSATTKKKMIKF